MELNRLIAQEKQHASKEAQFAATSGAPLTLQTNQFFYGQGHFRGDELHDEKMKTTDVGFILKQARHDLRFSQGDGYGLPRIEDECIVGDTEPDEVAVVQQPAAMGNH